MKTKPEHKQENPMEKVTGMWFCPCCMQDVDPHDVTHEERHDCGNHVVSKGDAIDLALTLLEFVGYTVDTPKLRVPEEDEYLRLIFIVGGEKFESWGDKQKGVKG